MNSLISHKCQVSVSTNNGHTWSTMTEKMSTLTSNTVQQHSKTNYLIKNHGNEAPILFPFFFTIKNRNLLDEFLRMILSCFLHKLLKELSIACWTISINHKWKFKAPCCNIHMWCKTQWFSDWRNAQAKSSRKLKWLKWMPVCLRSSGNSGYHISNP